MIARINFDHLDYNISAQAVITYGGLVTQLDLYFHDIIESDWPSSAIVLEEIENMATQLLLEEASTPEVSF